MEISFEHSSTQLLSNAERNIFFQRMKDVVVYIRCKHTEIGENNWIIGAGVFVRERKILTSSKLICKDCHVIEYALYEQSCKYKNLKFETALLSKWNENLGVAILTTKFCSTYCKLGNDEKMSCGSEVFTICHSFNLPYNLLIGSVACTSQLVKNIKSNDPNIESLNGNTRLIEIQGFNSVSASEGAPVFNNRGILLGILVFTQSSFGCAIDVQDLKTLFEERECKKNINLVKKLPLDPNLVIECSSSQVGLDVGQDVLDDSVCNRYRDEFGFQMHGDADDLKSRPLQSCQSRRGGGQSFESGTENGQRDRDLNSP